MREPSEVTKLHSTERLIMTTTCWTSRNRLLKHATRLQVRFQQTAQQVCLCLHMHPALCAACKSYNEKTGEASNTVAVLPFISALHNFILPVICARTCLKSYSTHPTSLFGPFCSHPLPAACGKGRSCDVCVHVCVCLGVRGLLVTHRYKHLFHRPLRERKSRLEAVWWRCKANRCTSEQREPQQKTDQNSAFT